MKRIPLFAALLFLIAAAGFAYWQFSTSPWLRHGQSSSAGASGPPKAPPGHGPTPEQMAQWMQEQKKQQQKQDATKPKGDVPKGAETDKKQAKGGEN